MNKLKAVIIDDIEDARIVLKKDLEEYCSEVEVVGEAEGVVTGMKLLKGLSLDIIFLDIQMNDGTGFDLLEIIGKSNAKVIFTTASDAFAIKAIKFSALEYLLKPIDPDELVEAVKKVQESQFKDGQQDAIEVLSNQLANQNKGKIALNTLERISVVNLSEIIRCESDVNYTQFYLKDSKKIVVTKTLKEYTELLADKGFIRVHQSHLVNLEHIVELDKQDGGSLVLSDGSYVPVSSRKRNEVITFLTNLK